MIIVEMLLPIVVIHIPYLQAHTVLSPVALSLRGQYLSHPSSGFDLLFLSHLAQGYSLDHILDANAGAVTGVCALAAVMVVDIDATVTCWHGPLMADVSSVKNVLPVPFL